MDGFRREQGEEEVTDNQPVEEKRVVGLCECRPLIWIGVLSLTTGVARVGGTWIVHVSGGGSDVQDGTVDFLG